ncbi:ABC transporter permease [Corynebacterium doosanense]|uniref:Peptide ABC transporter permease n=1 Tax=Corynebacterium doosanense CAU 212 = DSM 45436 TaxID=558173 RepID=A0A097IE86_9CORY|nr:ABC transporter permease [Corynebacterium doosanense]AIT60425.1 peptide ABC transporter permease [Corynebacterium doosanense CAU 212 = DSM 45436]
MRVNNRLRVLLLGALAFLLVAAIVVSAQLLPDPAPVPGARNLPVSAEHLLGTDRLGRDMFARTVQGAAMSMGIAAAATTLAALIAVVMAMLAALGPRWLDLMVSWLIDVTIGLPGIILMILISFSVGGGVRGTTLAIAVTHWPMLTRLLRAEIAKVRSADYVVIARRQAKSGWWIATRHVLPAIIAHVIVGLVVLFSQAIVHESALTFIGLGVAPTDPSLGTVLSEGMRNLTEGRWWLVLAAVVLLVTAAVVLDALGDALRSTIAPESRQD